MHLGVVRPSLAAVGHGNSIYGSRLLAVPPPLGLAQNVLCCPKSCHRIGQRGLVSVFAAQPRRRERRQAASEAKKQAKLQQQQESEDANAEQAGNSEEAEQSQQSTVAAVDVHKQQGSEDAAMHALATRMQSPLDAESPCDSESTSEAQVDLPVARSAVHARVNEQAHVELEPSLAEDTELHKDVQAQGYITGSMPSATSEQKLVHDPGNHTQDAHVTAGMDVAGQEFAERMAGSPRSLEEEPADNEPFAPQAIVLSAMSADSAVEADTEAQDKASVAAQNVAASLSAATTAPATEHAMPYEGIEHAGVSSSAHASPLLTHVDAMQQAADAPRQEASGSAASLDPETAAASLAVEAGPPLMSPSSEAELAVVKHASKAEASAAVAPITDPAAAVMALETYTAAALTPEVCPAVALTPETQPGMVLAPETDTTAAPEIDTPVVPEADTTVARGTGTAVVPVRVSDVMSDVMDGEPKVALQQAQHTQRVDDAELTELSQMGQRVQCVDEAQQALHEEEARHEQQAGAAQQTGVHGGAHAQPLTAMHEAERQQVALPSVESQGAGARAPEAPAPAAPAPAVTAAPAPAEAPAPARVFPKQQPMQVNISMGSSFNVPMAAAPAPAPAPAAAVAVSPAPPKPAMDTAPPEPAASVHSVAASMPETAPEGYTDPTIVVGGSSRVNGAGGIGSGGSGGGGGGGGGGNGGDEDSEHVQPASAASGESGKRLSSFFDLVWQRNFQPMALFIGWGILMAGLLITWIVGLPTKRWGSYGFTIMFSEAPKVRAGTPLRVKGVDIGSVTSVTPGLDQVAVGVEVNKKGISIPRDSAFLLTQTGMIPTSFIDIYPPGPGAPPVRRVRYGSRAAAEPQAISSATAAVQGAGSDGSAAAATPAAAAGRGSSMVQAALAVAEQQEREAARIASAADAASSLAAHEPAAAAGQDAVITAHARAGQEPAADASGSSTGPSGSSSSAVPSGVVQAGEVVYGEMGGSFDELTRRSIQGMLGSGLGRPQ